MTETTPIQIERALPEDVPHIAPLFDRYRQFYGQTSDLTGADAFLRTNLKTSQSVIFFACRAERSHALGFTQLYPTYSSVSMKKSWIFNDLYVDAASRANGAGRALLEAARKHAVETGAKGLELVTATDNVKAQRLYEAAGYKKDSDFYRYFLRVEEG